MIATEEWNENKSGISAVVGGASCQFLGENTMDYVSYMVGGLESNLPFAVALCTHLSYLRKIKYYTLELSSSLALDMTISTLIKNSRCLQFESDTFLASCHSELFRSFPI
jgi:hypothetical protein